MGLVSIVTFGIKDFVGGPGGRKSLPIYVPAATTLAEAQAFVTAGAAILDNLVDGVIEDATVTLTLTLPVGIKSTPVSGNTVHEGGLLDWAAAGTAYAFSHFIPSMANSKFTGDTVDTGDADVGDWETQMIAPGVGQPNPTDKYANDINAYVAGVRKFRK